MTTHPAKTMREIRTALGHLVPPPDVPEPTVTPVTYTVSCLPSNDDERHHFDLTVQYRGAGRWAVQRGEHACLGADGTWANGVKPYDRGDDWLAAHRFDLDTALKMAKEAAPHVTVNGFTVADALAMYARRTAEEPTR